MKFKIISTISKTKEQEEFNLIRSVPNVKKRKAEDWDAFVKRVLGNSFTCNGSFRDANGVLIVSYIPLEYTNKNTVIQSSSKKKQRINFLVRELGWAVESVVTTEL